MLTPTMGRKRNTKPKTEATNEPEKKDRHKDRYVVNLPKPWQAAVYALAKRNDRTMVAEIERALRAHFKAEGHPLPSSLTKEDEEPPSLRISEE